MTVGVVASRGRRPPVRGAGKDLVEALMALAAGLRGASSDPGEMLST